MKYEFASDLQERMISIVKSLNMSHIDLNRVKCFRSKGSSTKRTLARCHTIGKLMQKTIGVEAHYAIEFLEKFEKLSLADQDKVIIHELMHIPKTFGGGFRQHDFVCEENVEKLHRQYQKLNGMVNEKSEIKMPSFLSMRKLFEFE
ncbi:MAG: putative metallopeptidase [Nanoarchaeota archaeon]|mgnify:CR=1 FL=1